MHFSGMAEIAGIKKAARPGNSLSFGGEASPNSLQGGDVISGHLGCQPFGRIGGAQLRGSHINLWLIAQELQLPTSRKPCGFPLTDGPGGHAKESRCLAVSAQQPYGFNSHCVHSAVTLVRLMIFVKRN
jgi:hypothetical protein